jgi:hypothetical protein
VKPARVDWDGDGRGDVVFFDCARRQLRCGSEVLALPDAWRTGELCRVYALNLGGDARTDFAVFRMDDTRFARGRGPWEITECSPYTWAVYDSRTGWSPSYEQWYWTEDVPLTADLDGDDVDELVAYRYRTGEWFGADGARRCGVGAPRRAAPVPVALRDPSGASWLGVWRASDGWWIVCNADGSRTNIFRLGDKDDWPMPADYDGDGWDDPAVTEVLGDSGCFLSTADGREYSWQAGCAKSLPVPYDYNSDGRIDPGWWDRSARVINVCTGRDSREDFQLPVPSNSVPVHVEMY